MNSSHTRAARQRSPRRRPPRRRPARGLAVLALAGALGLGVAVTAARALPSREAAVDASAAGAGATGTLPAGGVRIHDIQGDGFVSRYVGRRVGDVAGIVTATRTYGASRGYWIQDPAPDADPATSEGIFVYTGSDPAVAAGDAVLVGGTVRDYYPLASGETAASTSQLSVTEIDQSAAPTVLSSHNPLPAPVVLTPASVPDSYAPDLRGGDIESTPITPARSALDYYESIEGMRVEVDDARMVGPSAVFGSGADSDAEQYVTTKPDQDVTYRGGTELRGENQTPSGRLKIVTAGADDPDVDVGDVLQGAWIGPLDYFEFAGYGIVASTLGTVRHDDLRPAVAAGPAPGRLSIATYNVENLSPTDPAAKFAALGQGVVSDLASPDIVALEEIQDDDGTADDGAVDATATLTELTRAIAAAGGPSYRWQSIDPADDQDGGDPGGNIRIAYLYNPDRVSFVARGDPAVDRTVTGTRLRAAPGAGGQTAVDLSLSPGRIDPTSPVWRDSRKSLVGEFAFDGQPVFVVADHFVAKLGDQNADGRFQYPEQSSVTQRDGQALAVHDFVASLLRAAPQAAVVVVGDLNDYPFSPALRTLETGRPSAGGTPLLTDLITTLPADQRYTYDLDGVSEVLDHILVSPGVRDATYQVVHVNAEYAHQASDHDPQVVDLVP